MKRPENAFDEQTIHVRRGAARGATRLIVVDGPERGQVWPIRQAGVVLGSGDECDVRLSDRTVSRQHARVVPHPQGVLVEDLESRNGTLVNGARVTSAIVSAGARLVIGDTELSIEPELRPADLPPMEVDSYRDLIGGSPVMRRLFTAIERAGRTHATVLVEGETGTGKERVARALHDVSPRAGGPFVVFDAASTPPNLIESELFGHVRGAFTGAVRDRDGCFRRAHGGTLFLDELNSLPLALQGKLLRALESHRVVPVGQDGDVRVDVRIIAAANERLATLARQGAFREDLAFRLSVVRLALPPLRARMEDLPMLTRAFLQQLGSAAVPEGRNLEVLLGYGWPGNVRELRNVIEGAVVLAGRLDAPFDELPIVLGDGLGETASWPMPLELPFKEAKEQVVGAFERTYAAHALERAGGNVSEMARTTGLSRRHCYDLLNKHGLLAPGDPEV